MKNWILLFIVSYSVQAATNWPQFRGPGALGVAENKGLPGKWSTSENVLWKQQVSGRGWSSPVVWGKQVFLTAVETEGKQWEARKGLYFGGERKIPPTGKHHWKVICLNLETGKLIWEKTAHSGIPKGSIHIKNSYASETPITDGERVYAYFGNVGVFALDLDGQLRWSHTLSPLSTRLEWGTAASPVLFGNRLYVVNDNDDGSYLLALDTETGAEVWRVDREEGTNWSTPFVWENELRTEIVTTGSDKFELSPPWGHGPQLLLKLKDNVKLDREASATETVAVRFTEGDGTEHTGTFTLQVLDVDEAPEVIGLTSLTLI